MDDNNTIQTTMSGLINDVRDIVESGLRKAYQNVNAITVFTYWQVGKRIVEEEQQGEKRAEYGRRLIETLAQVLSMNYSRGFSARDLRNYRQLYLCFNDLEIWYTRVPNLTWSHYRTLLSVTSDDARYWYVKEASREMWSVRTLARNVGSQDDTQGDTQGGTQGDALDIWIEEQIRKNPKVTTEELATLSGFTSKTIKRHINKLTHIKYVGRGYSGHWEIVENDAEA